MIQFIHVGKCAGSSIKTALTKLNIDFNEYHCYDSKTALNIKLNQKDTSFYLLTVRDPIKRFISAFYWDFYEKRILNDSVGPNGLWKKCYEIFKSPNEVAEALTSKDSTLKDLAECYILNSKLHAEFSLSWYVSVENVKYLSNLNCHVIRTERADEDFQKILERFSVSLSGFSGLTREKQEYKDSINNYNVTLSELGRNNLNNAYLDDYMVLDGLYRRGLIDERY
jgi:hypothetical protein